MARILLHTLPMELLLLVTSFLSAVDVSCLALCNRRLFSLSSCFRDMNPQMRFKLLVRLARHLPQYHACYGCRKLHLWRFIDLPSQFFDLPSCFDRHTLKEEELYLYLRLDVMQFITIPPSPLNFHFVHLHLAMRRFYFGPDFGIATESLSRTDVCLFRPIYLRRYYKERVPSGSPFASYRTGLNSFEARACANPPGLCLRIQHLAVVERKNLFDLCNQDEYIQICNHIGNFTSRFYTTVNDLFQEYRHSTQRADILLREGMCDQCSTSWKLELREIEENEICLCLTRWIDLGPGLEPEDSR
ncbi:hypothetical protein N7478_009340 [Penicillium angulare]|uniref:uncharacterized protein n=1 Tax=Penicillium angulare TaxID=116970 RepID=UPI0025413182|nr:uncharacterized protein N7478_009340 [Penicillium angulare]KAJ5266532.1 hypothetical protein N7478_009340 [Penicillium angulare]